jgi:hypothetical protein
MEEFAGLKFETNESLKSRIKQIDDAFDSITIEYIDQQLEKLQH